MDDLGLAGVLRNLRSYAHQWLAAGQSARCALAVAFKF
ncbi:hypothetical protein THTE_3923 [Thermogutta terrifontis]|uniref:Uncharacterized protein n=1 Tax=Thermogutta terrifontis TaxID=1331910 RepID=A0A286RKP5_9BACT|nr:hypothetical protein THTE_3923 [Thermogutta terrifontis]